MKMCTKCKKNKAKSEFYVNNDKRYKARLLSHCKECVANTWREWYKKNPDVRREQHLIKKYNMTLAEYDSLLLSQDGLCKICRTNTPGGNGRFHVDHDHKNGKVRGILCNKCNTGLGNFMDSIDILSAALLYLEANRRG